VETGPGDETTRKSLQIRQLRRSNTIQFLRLWQKGTARDAQHFLDKIQEDASTNEIPVSMKLPAND
jgi:hypothetical protein